MQGETPAIPGNEIEDAGFLIGLYHNAASADITAAAGGRFLSQKIEKLLPARPAGLLKVGFRGVGNIKVDHGADTDCIMFFPTKLKSTFPNLTCQIDCKLNDALLNIQLENWPLPYFRPYSKPLSLNPR
jgi:hypothetical protein